MVWVADRHNNLIAKGRTLDSLKEAMILGDPIRFEENDAGQANVYIDEEGWFAVTGDKDAIDGWAGVFGRTLKSVEQFKKVLAKHGQVRSVRTDDDGNAFVGFKGAGDYLIIAEKPPIWKAALADINARFA